MSRPSLFVLVVLVGAAAVVGLVALTRSSAATKAEAPAGTAGEAQIAYRLKQLDAVEADLKKRIAAASKPVPATGQTGLRAQPAVVVGPALASVSASGDDDEYEHEDHDDRGEHGEHGEGDRDD